MRSFAGSPSTEEKYPNRRDYDGVRLTATVPRSGPRKPVGMHDPVARAMVDLSSRSQLLYRRIARISEPMDERRAEKRSPPHARKITRRASDTSARVIGKGVKPDESPMPRPDSARRRRRIDGRVEPPPKSPRKFASDLDLAGAHARLDPDPDLPELVSCTSMAKHVPFNMPRDEALTMLATYAAEKAKYELELDAFGVDYVHVDTDELFGEGQKLEPWQRIYSLLGLPVESITLDVVN